MSPCQAQAWNAAQEEASAIKNLATIIMKQKD
jgi:hypothetical protein